MGGPETAVIVPARLGSTRFHRKLLREVRGRPLILWTAQAIRRGAPDLPLVFAVDGPELAGILEARGFETIRTDPNLPSGTDRVAAANREVGARRVLNVQADEPMVTGEHIRALDRALAPGVDMATLGTPLLDPQEYRDPNRVKLVRARDGRALYFSRAPIPHFRDTPDQLPLPAEPNRPGPGAGAGGPDPSPAVYAHLGLYAYTAEFLQRFTTLEPGFLEQAEKLEQLRALEHGFTIATGIVAEGLIGIDTPENLAAFEGLLDPEA